MPLEVIVKIETIEADNPDAWLDPFEVEQLLNSTREQMRAHVQHALGEMVCPEHGEAPFVTVYGTYDMETENLDFSYDVQTCCSTFLAQCIAALNLR